MTADHVMSSSVLIGSSACLHARSRPVPVAVPAHTVRHHCCVSTGVPCCGADCQSPSPPDGPLGLLSHSPWASLPPWVVAVKCKGQTPIQITTIKSKSDPAQVTSQIMHGFTYTKGGSIHLQIWLCPNLTVFVASP